MNLTENRSGIGRDMLFRELRVGDIVTFTSGSTSSLVIGKIEEISESRKTCKMSINNGPSIIKRRCPEVLRIGESLSKAKEENPEYFI